MKREIETKFYTYNQNNSGGSFCNDDKAGISEYVCIEALNAQDANNRAEGIGIYFDGCDSGMDCSCCGDRWYKCDESDGTNIPMMYGEPLENLEKSMFRTKAFIHYMDGSFKEIVLKEKAQ